MPIQGKACTGSFMGRLSFARTPDPQFVLHSHVACHVKWSGLLSHARKALCLLILTIVMCGAVKTRIGPDMCARRREGLIFGCLSLTKHTHTQSHREPESLTQTERRVTITVQRERERVLSLTRAAAHSWRSSQHTTLSRLSLPLTFQSDLAEDTCSRTNCAQPFAVEGYALGPSV